jgi:hypothetical protein
MASTCPADGLGETAACRRSPLAHDLADKTATIAGCSGLGQHGADRVRIVDHQRA